MSFLISADRCFSSWDKNFHSSSWFISLQLLLIKSAKCLFYHIWTGHQSTLPVYVTFTSASNLILAQSCTQVDCSGTSSQVSLIHFPPLQCQDLNLEEDDTPKHDYIQLYQCLRDQECFHNHLESFVRVKSFQLYIRKCTTVKSLHMVPYGLILYSKNHFLRSSSLILVTSLVCHSTWG